MSYKRRGKCPHLKWIICVGLEENQLPSPVISSQRWFSDMPTELKSVDLKERELACVIYTSGTSGFPKGAMHVHKSLLLTGEAFLVRAQINPNDRIMTVLPLFHINAQFYSTWGAIAGEASLILIRQFSASQFWRQAVRYGATEFNFVGTLGGILCSRPEVPTKLNSVDLKERELACVIYTSGTSGFPKGAMHVHKSLLLTGEAFLVRAQINPNDRIMTVLPLFHINAQFYSTWGAIAGEASLILIRQFSASQFWRQAVRYGATEFNFVGTLGGILCSRPEEEFCPEHTIRVAVGAGISPDVYKTFTKRFRIPNVIDAYGLTEVPESLGECLINVGGNALI